jgi:hypothetical protein
MRKMVMLVSAVVAAVGLAVAGPASEGERINPQRISNLALIFSDVVLALAVWGWRS